MIRSVRLIYCFLGLVLSLSIACAGGADNSRFPSAEPGFSLFVVQPVPIQASTSGTATVMATRTGGHSAAISLNLQTNTQGIAGIGSIASGASSGTLTIIVPSSIAAGTYSLMLSGSDSSLPARTAAVNLTVTSVTLTNSTDADGFLWGTEGSVLIKDFANITGTETAIRDTIKNTLKTKYVKIRPQNNIFTSNDGGLTYSPSGCMPSPSSCLTPFNLDETVRFFKASGLSMVPMFTYDRSATSVTTADIDSFVNFVSWFVDRCKAGASIQYIELEDFPASWWPGTNAQLLEMTNKIYDRIKASHPDVQVGTPGFEYWSDTLDATTSKAVAGIEYFLNRANGAKFDYWAFHGYALAEVLAAGKFAQYPPTRVAVSNKYAGIPGILEVRKALDANGWQDRPILDTEHFGVGPTMFTDSDDRLDAAYMVQHDLLERTLHTATGGAALSGVLSLKIFPSGTQLTEHGALNSDGSPSKHLKAVGLMRDKLRDYNYSSRLSGAFDNEGQAWIEKFQSGNKQLYIFFKPFHYAAGKSILLDGQTPNYSLSLGQVPTSIILTDINGSTTALTPAQSLVLAVENSPKFLEIVYP